MSENRKKLAVGDLFVDDRIQRSLDLYRVRKLAANFDDSGLGVLTVSARPGGRFHLVDGQHRHAAAMIVHGEGYLLDCRVFDGLDLAEEAKLFRLLNNTRVPQAIDQFRVRVVEGDGSAVAINQAIERNGWHLELTAGNGAFAAVAAAERLYRKSPEAVGDALLTVAEVWGYGQADGRLFEAVGNVLVRYSGRIDRADLVRKLTDHAPDAASLIDRGRAIANVRPCRLSEALSELIVDIYNKGRKSVSPNRLDPWVRA